MQRLHGVYIALASAPLYFRFLYWLIDKKRIMRWTNFFKPAASNPLLTYIIPDIIYYVTALMGIVIVPHFLDQDGQEYYGPLFLPLP